MGIIAASPFGQLHADLMRMAGLPYEEPEETEEGALVAEFRLNGVPVELLCASTASRSFYGRLLCGRPEGSEKPEFWNAVLFANHGFACRGEPVFARDPLTGDLVVQASWPEGTSPEEVMHALATASQVAADSSDAQFDVSHPHAFTANQQRRDDQAQALLMAKGQARFDDLIASFRAEPGLQGLQVEDLEPGSSFVVYVGDIAIQIAHFGHAPDRLHLFGHIAARDLASDETPGDLAELNAMLLCEPHAALVCFLPLAGGYVLHTSQTFDNLHAAAGLKGMIAAQARSIREIRSQFFRARA